MEPLRHPSVGVEGVSYEERYLVGDNDITDHFIGYSDGYFAGVMAAKFGKTAEGTGDYPDTQAYVRGYASGTKDSAEITADFSNDEKATFAEGFADEYIDGNNLCD